MALRVAGRLGMWIGLGLGEGCADEVVLHPVADTCLFEWTADYNFGAQGDLPAGGLGGAAGSERLARALFKFDVAGALPAGAVITMAEAQFRVTTAPETGSRSSPFALHRVLVDWGEGEKSGERPGGALATAGEATWEHRFVPDVGWSVPGGQFGVDFATVPSAVNGNVDAAGDYVFAFDASGVAGLQSMLEDPERNFGWVLYSEEEELRKTARRWGSRESEGAKPELRITWVAPLSPPEITAVELDEAGEGIIVRVEGLAGLRYASQLSADLADWEPGEVQTPVTDGELVFLLPAGTRGFFRVVATRLP